jgi:hypothetical protein
MPRATADLTRTRRSKAIFLAAMLASLTSTTGAHAADKLLLVSWDGAARHVVRELVHYQPAHEEPRECPAERFAPVMPQACGEYWSCLPNLCRFEIIDSWDSEGKPLTKPQHAQMLTGYSPRTTGVFRNSSAASVPEGYTIYERLKAGHGGELKTIHIAGRKYVGMGVTRKAERAGAIDENARRGGPDKRTGVNTTARALPLLQKYAGGPFFFFVHYKEADVTAHLRSVDSASYREALIQIDRELGVLIAALDENHAMPETAVIVTSDHGFTGRFHVSREESNLETFVAALNLDLVRGRNAKLLDITPTILDYFGVPTEGLSPPLEGRSLLLGAGGATTTTTSTTTPSSTLAVTTTVAAPPSSRTTTTTLP